jgi:hypothetical protein
LKQWAEFYRIPLTQLTQANKCLPSLVTVRTATEDSIVYPSRLVFVPTDTKLTPASLAGMNGISSINHGLTEDLGSKALRHIYQDQLKSNVPQTKDMIDYWSYNDQIIYTSNTVMHALSMIDSKYQQNQLLLQKALTEPVMASPIMNTKSVFPFHYKSPGALNRQSITPPNNITSIDLIEFARASFLIKQQEQETATSDLLNGLNPMQDPSITLASSSDRLEAAGKLL